MLHWRSVAQRRALFNCLLLVDRAGAEQCAATYAAEALGAVQRSAAGAIQLIPEQLVADLRIGNLALAIGQNRQAETGGQATEGDNHCTHDKTPLTAVFGVCCFCRVAAANKTDDA